jgi:hypothetical protein
LQRDPAAIHTAGIALVRQNYKKEEKPELAKNRFGVFLCIKSVMKLRIRDNSVRLRLMRGEVETLRDTGLVSASTPFPGGRTFRYCVESSPASVSIAAFFSDNVRLPETTVLAWANSEQVSISGEQVLADGDQLKILVEKDFVCLTNREDEDEKVKC